MALQAPIQKVVAGTSQQTVLGQGADLSAVAQGAGDLAKGLEIYKEREDGRIAHELLTHATRMLSDLKTGSTVDQDYWTGLSQRTGIDIDKLQAPLNKGSDLLGYQTKPGALFSQDDYKRTSAFTQELANAYIGMSPTRYQDAFRAQIEARVTGDLGDLGTYYDSQQRKVENERHLAERDTLINNALSEFDTPEARNENTIEGLFAISGHGREMGHSREAILADQQAFNGAITEGVIDRYLAQGRYQAANDYWDQAKDGFSFTTDDGRSYHVDMPGSQMAKIEAKLATGATVGTAALKAEGDDILANLNDGIVDPRAHNWLDRANALAPYLKQGKGVALHNVFDKVKDAVDDQPLVEAYQRLPMPQQRELIDTMIANRITKPKDAKELKKAERITRLLKKYQAAHDKTQSMIDNGEGLLAAVEHIPGVKEQFEPIDWANPDPTALYNRTRLAEALSSPSYYGQTVAPLTKAEATELAGVVDNMPADQGAAYMAQLARSFGLGFTPSATGVLVDSGQPELGIALYHGGDQFSREILHGLKVKAGLAKGEGSVFKLTATDRRDAVESAFGTDGAEVLNQLGEDAGAFIKAADAIYYSRAQNGNVTDFDSDVYEQALKDALGGTFVFNGHETIAPVPGMSQADFEKQALAITSDDLRMFGNGQPMTADGQAIDIENLTGVESVLFGGRRRSLDRPYQLVYVGPGRYQLKNSLGFVSADGSAKRYEFDFRAYMESKGE